MKVLIIGGMGVIGGAITKAAAQKKIDVYVLSRRDLFGEWLNLGVTGIKGDWKNDEFARKVVKEDFDVIIDTQVFDEKQLIRSLEIADGHCKQYIYISTDSIYAHPAENLIEDDPIDLREVHWDYGIDKLKAELYLVNHGDKYKFFWTGIRPTITFGNTRIPVGYATKRNTYTLAERILEGKPIIRFDDPKTRHAVCHTSIFGAAAVSLLLNEKAAGQFFHISDDYAYSYDEIFDAIEKVLGAKGIYVHVPTESIKLYSRSLYEEMIYDKNPEFTLNNNKIKSMAPSVNYHMDIIEVMSSTLSYLDNHKKDSEGDDEYNLITDNILLTYVNNIDDAGLKNKVNKYIEGFSKDYLEQLRGFRKKRKVDTLLYPLKKCKCKIKSALDNILNTI